MKVTVEGDCTPAEAREFIGLPDLRPTQTAMAKRLEEQMTESLDKISFDAVLQNWFTFNPKNSIQDLFANFITRAATRAEGDKMELPRT
jgi:hypothetical protein